ncbi:hypothetical protein KI387_005597 [Taxus chinensis]|uniref:PUB 12/19-like N-terminal domain-containing protein n=1 Tax=Taxus chinensis TaxID=29808 RepID=A0AA38GKD8_TAXCH|nr:hypothetical protein KI387_005597 [Taxus chinensis]
MLAEQVALKLIDVLNEITSLGECRNFMRKEYATLSKRVKLLSPLFEEMKEIETSIPGDAIDFFDALEAALLSAKELLNFTHDGSKLFLHIFTTVAKSENNKRTIVMVGAIPPIVKVLKSGSMEARENVVATRFSLSFPNEHNTTIGKSGAIPTLVDLLRDGNQRGKKDALNAFFHLCVYQ